MIGSLMDVKQPVVEAIQLKNKKKKVVAFFGIFGFSHFN